MKKILLWIYNQVAKINRFFRIHHILRVNKDYTCVWIYPHIGDAFYALPYISKYKKKNDCNICLIGCKKYKYIYELFTGIDKYYLVDEKTIFGFGLAHIGFFTRRMLIKKIENKSFVSNDYNLMAKLHPNHGCKTFQAFTKKYIYQLGDEVIDYPKAERKQLNKKPYIIIAPYANTAKKIPSEVFETIIDELGKRYIIYTNVGSGQEKLDGTVALDCGLLDLASYASCAEAFIGLRSGVCDMVGAMTQTKMFVFYNSYKLKSFISVLDYRKDHSTVIEFYDTDYQSYIKEIVNNI